MSITVLEPVSPDAPSVMLHEAVWIEESLVPAPGPTGKRFPPVLRTLPATPRRHCAGDAPTTPVAPSDPVAHEGPDLPGAPATRSARWSADEPDTDQYIVPAEVQPVIERIFPKADSMDNLEESVGTIVHAVAPALLEVLAGARPARQLAGALSPECMGKLERHLLVGRNLQPDPASCCYSNPRVLRIRISQILPRVFEAAAIMLDIKKVRATALRIELWHGRWQVTAMEIG